MKKKLLLLVLSSLSLFGCTSNNSDNNKNVDDTDTNKETFVNNVDEKKEMPTIDITSDYESQSEEELEGTTIDVSTLTETTHELTESGTYILTGTNSNLSISVASNIEVTLILNNVNITSETENPPLTVSKATSFKIYVPKKTKNYLKDSALNTLDGVINVKKVNLEIEGEGYLYLTSLGEISLESGKAIHCAKTLLVDGTHILIDSSNDHALNGKEGVTITDSKLKLVSEADGIHSKEGGITLSNTTLISETKGDGIDATSTIDISDSNLYITTNGEFILYDGSDTTYEEDARYIYENNTYKKVGSDETSRYRSLYYLKEKCKGIKSDADITISKGTYYLYTTDDSISSDTNITIKEGNFYIDTYDQGINAELIVNIGESSTSTINENLNIYIYDSYEGVQGGQINFFDGNVYIVSQDDGINASSDTLTDISLNIHSPSYVNVTGGGDGIDSNGDITMDGGTFIVFGLSEGGDGTLDFEDSFSLTGGTLIAVGASDMAQTPTNSQNMFVATLNSNFSKDETLSFVTNEYEFSTILKAEYRSMFFLVSSDKLVLNNTYEVVKGATSNHKFTNNIYFGEASITGGTSLVSGTLESKTTTSGRGNDGGNRPNPR